jgi:periplasmic divalent cation tolerance protein
MLDVIQVSTTTDRPEVAAAIADALVTQGLAACVAIGGPTRSVYRWQGRVETAEEWTCTAKTVRRLYVAVEARIRALHNYQEPEILVTDVAGGSPSYLDWLRAQVAAAPTVTGTPARDASAGTTPFPPQPPGPHDPSGRSS